MTFTVQDSLNTAGWNLMYTPPFALLANIWSTISIGGDTGATGTPNVT